MTANTPCQKCGGEMVDGFILESGHYNSPSAAMWTSGRPEKSFLTGVKTAGRDQYPIRSFRCNYCGFLESYAVAITREI